MTIQAPAKVNLVLRVLGKRPDGFHDLETLMAPLTLCDELDIETSPGTGIDLTCDDPQIPQDEQNLAWRAAKLFAERTGINCRTRIFIRKRIPYGAGLAGGSSDGVAVLKALNAIHQAGLGDTELERLSAHLGSDTAFFVRCRPAWCKGRGDVIEPASAIPETNVLLLKPPFPVPTAWAYKHWTPNVLPRQQPAMGPQLVNDLEDTVFRKFLLLPSLKAWLIEQPEVEAAMMSGSGSTIFAILRDRPSQLEKRVRDRFGELIWTHECRVVGK